MIDFRPDDSVLDRAVKLAVWVALGILTACAWTLALLLGDPPRRR